MSSPIPAHTSEVRCVDCSGDYELSAGAARAQQRQGREPRCRRCRRTSDEPSPTAAHRAWWLERFTLAEIQEMALALWPEDGAGETVAH